MRKRNRSWIKGIGILVMVILAIAVFTMCSKSPNEPLSPVKLDGGTIMSVEHPEIQKVMRIQERNTEMLMKHPQVAGTATGLTEEGQPCILVLTKTAMQTNSLRKGVNDAIANGDIPSMIENTPVRIMEVGEIRAMKVPKPTPVDHKAKQTAPIQLGTSGGWRYDLANGYCCGGTLGSLIQKSGKQYILSNYHVLMADIVAGGNSRTVQDGDPVIQPALIDVGCNAANAQNVGTIAFAGTPSLPSSNVDAGVAEVIAGMVRTDGAILEIGTLSAQTVAAAVNQAVKKSGRTTGLTRSTVSGLNATISVAYDNECAGGAAFTKTFTGQIVVANSRSKFLDSGDSGSLMVQDVTTNPRAIGLLFAGSTTTAIANPIGQVLSFYGATMVGL
jgi:hypothetical protein